MNRREGWDFGFASNSRRREQLTNDADGMAQRETPQAIQRPLFAAANQRETLS